MSAAPARRPSADVLLAVLIPLVCAGLVLLVHPSRDSGPADHAPDTAPLTTAAVLCPSGLAGTGADTVGVASLGDGTAAAPSGQVSVGLGGTPTAASVRPDRVTGVTPGPGPTVVTGQDGVAPGLLAGRAQSAPLAAADCPPPSGDQWFTGVGAGATHDSVLELVNPNPATAEADVTVWSPTGLVALDSLRGVSVPGGTSTRLDLGKLVPRRGDLALEVHTDRGQLAAFVTDAVDELGNGARSQDWLPAQAAPSTANLMVGLVPGTGDRSLVVANPGDSEVRATVKVATTTATFAPSGVEEIRVPPQSTVTVRLGDVLQDATSKGAIGLLVESTGPVSTGLRQDVDGDLVDLAGSAPLDAASALVVPPGVKHVYLAGPSAVGTAEVTWWSAGGRQLGSQTVKLTPDTGGDVVLPTEAALVTVTPARTTVHAAVLVQGTGNAVVGFRVLQRTALVPDVRPGLP